MKSNYFASIALALAMLLPLGAIAGDTRVLEDGREVAASMLSLPQAAEGTVVIQGCTACAKVLLQIGSGTRYYIAKQEVTFADLKIHLLAHPDVAVLVVSPIRQKSITRIRASGAIAQ
jgi:hypothetical protein